MRVLFSVFRSYSVPAFWKERVYIGFAFCGLVLAVSLFTSVLLANRVVLREFREAVDAISGSSSYQIVPRSEYLAASTVLPLLHREPSVRAVFPIRKERIDVELEGERLSVMLVGIDVLNEHLAEVVGGSSGSPTDTGLRGLLTYGEVLVSEELAKLLPDGRISIWNQLGEELSLRVTPTSSSLFSLYDGRVVIADLSLVDEVMQSFGLLTEVNLRFKDELEGEAVAARLRELLPKDVLIVDPDRQFQRISQTSEALRMNLTFLAALSLLVALLLGFQVMSLLAVRRKGDYATLISLGTSPSHLGKLIVFESMCIGVVGGVVGGLLGHLLGDYTVRAVQTTIDHFYTPVWERGVQFDIHVLLCVALVGGCIGLLGALLPAWSVFARPPSEYFSRESESSSLRPRVGYLFFFGILLIGLGMLSASPQFLTSNPFAPFLSPLFLSVGMLLLSPALLFAFACVGRGVSQYMDSASLIALESVTARLRDMSIAVGALGVAFGMLIGISTMISSFRVTFQEWLDHILKADLFVSHYELTGISNKEREKFLTYSAANPAVIGVHTATQYPYTFKNSKVFLRSTNLELSRDFDTLVFLSPKEPHWDSVLQGAGVFVSESFSRKFDIFVGERLLLHLSDESLDFKVEGVFQDFSSDLGSILIHDSVLSRFGLPGGHDLGISLFLKPSADVEQVQRELLQEFPGRLKMRDRRALKLEALRIFDNTFTITYVLQGLTLFISALFLVLALLLSVFDRRKEQLTLRTIGASFGFLQQVVVREALILSASATFLGVLLGAALSWVLVYRINVIFFGWTVKLLPPYLVMIADIGGFFVVSVALAVLVSRVSLREIPLEVLRYE